MREIKAKFDPNVRVWGSCTYVGFEDLDGHVGEGDSVTLFEPEGGIEVPGVVLHIDSESRLVYVTVGWDNLKRTSSGG